MTLPFPVKSAEALMDAQFHGRWMDRASIGPAARATLRTIHARLVAAGAPVDVSGLGAAAAIEELDARDLIYVHDGRVVLAYPWSATPTPFVTVLADGRERWACCAIDALGVAALLKESVTVRARCHHCAERLELAVTPTGPLGGAGVMAWMGERGDLRGKACTAL